MPVNDYEVTVSGATPLGNAENRPRAVIRLRENAKTLGFIKFFDPGIAIPPDVQRSSGTGVIIEMNLPTSLLGVIVDLLRKESPINFSFGDGRCHVVTQFEAVGEDEVSSSGPEESEA